MKTVLFVCTGNTCRSPMAEAAFRMYLRETGNKDVEVLSRGLTVTGGTMAENAALALKQANIPAEATRRAEPLTRAEALAANILCGMTANHTAALSAMGVPEEKLLCANVPDPFGGDLNTYRACLAQIRAFLPAVAERVVGFGIRPFDEADASDVAAIERTCFSVPWSQTALLESYRAGTKFFTAKIGGKTAGYAGVTVPSDIGYMTNIAVLPEYRLRGIGHALISRLGAACTETRATEISLEVRPSNTAALMLYRKSGFCEVGRRRKFYTNPVEDALIFTKRLSGTEGCL